MQSQFRLTVISSSQSSGVAKNSKQHAIPRLGFGHQGSESLCRSVVCLAFRCLAIGDAERLDHLLHHFALLRWQAQKGVERFSFRVVQNLPALLGTLHGMHRTLAKPEHGGEGSL